jgi:hypothetical protein
VLFAALSPFKIDKLSAYNNSVFLFFNHVY